MLPHQGAGAGQAIEVSCLNDVYVLSTNLRPKDAYILAQILGYEGVTKETLPNALRAYEKIRMPIANKVLQGSRESGMMYEFNSELGQDFVRLGPAIQKQWDWIWESSPEDDAHKAIDCFCDITSPSSS